MVPFSVLDLSFVAADATPSEALRNTADLAIHAERWGYRRFWLAEHHGMPGIASSATAVVMGHVAGATRHIRVGAGGIMLPNHAPLLVAEQFGTLESLYPGRIDLGVGRAPGSDQSTMRALRRSPAAADTFAADVMELQALFAPAQPGQRVQAVPGAGLQVPIWILGSSLFGAQLAASLGLPFAFASHFMPGLLVEALRIYRDRFVPSTSLAAPRAMAGVNVVLAPSGEDARTLFTSAQQSFANLVRGMPGRLPPPVPDIEAVWSPMEKAQASQMLACSFVGAPSTVARDLRDFVARTGVDELIVVTAVHDHAARLRSYELLADLFVREPGLPSAARSATTTPNSAP
jgi:luciferase family oxidoreductase group 1